MTLAVSNIAWPPEENEAAFSLLADLGLRSVEVAPTKVNSQWDDITPASVAAYRAQLSEHGLKVSSLQSVLYNRPELLLFGTSEARAALRAHFIRVLDIADALGAKKVVFGSPRNRQRGETSPAEADRIAREFFSDVGAQAAARGVIIGLEPNARIYGCDYIVHAREALALVRAVNSPGFRIHLDTACMHLENENFSEVITDCSAHLCHFHISEPRLGSFASPAVDHAAVARALHAANYRGTLAIEMAAPATDWQHELRIAIEIAQRIYSLCPPRELI